ncbi:YceI family protein [Lacihabitans sp. LS3-19]|uniref:YceI family protein n=1 Tax=Lacihabitans sp. LS3-19 TaxID=2487335 RepID=UPI0020CFCAD6|nr:YceI family protein [Lacihabitans sp. LS3-19]
MITQTKWSIDQAHSEITFKVKHLMIAHVKGSFKIFNASIYTYGTDFKTAEVDLWIDVSSIDTGNKERDEHLKSLDFLDVANHKQITFISSTMQKPDKEGESELWGELTILGVTQNVKLEADLGGIVNDPWGNQRAGLSVKTKINRVDWGLVWNTNLIENGVMVGDEVSIISELELVNIGFKELKMEEQKTENLKA